MTATSATTDTGTRIGWASRDVTPDRPAILRGQFHVRISKGVQNPLTVTALAIDSGADQCVMVSADRVSIPDCVRDQVRTKLAGMVPHLEPRKVFINATHTHTAPPVNSKWEDQGPEVTSPEEYETFLVEQMAACVTEAWQSRGPGKLSWGFGEAVIGHNRRISYRDGSAHMYGNTNDPTFTSFEGHQDHAVDLLFAHGPTGELTGMVVNLACPSQVTEGDSVVSADFWHEARTEIRSRHGEHIFVLPQCAPAGDQSPHLLVNQRAYNRMLELRGYGENLSGRAGLAQRLEIGRRIANAVDDVLPFASKDMRVDVPVAHVVKDLELPRRMVTAEEYEEAKAEVAEYTRQIENDYADDPPSGQKRSYCFGRRGWYQGVLDRYEQAETMRTYPMELHVVRVGDVAFATNSFELYLDFGTRMKAQSRAVQTFLVQLAGQGTYLPTVKSMQGKSYGSVPASNQVGPDGGQIIVEETVAAIAELFGD